MMGKGKGSKGKRRDGGDGVGQEGGKSVEDMLYLETLKVKVESLTQRAEGLREENRKLKSAAVQAERDTHEFVAYFQQEIESKTLQLKEALERLQRQERDHVEEKCSMEGDLLAKIKLAESQAAKTTEELEGKVKQLELELSNVLEFKTNRHQLVAELEEAKSALYDERKRNSERLQETERKFLEEKSKLQREMEKGVADIKRASREEAQKGLTADIRKVIADNRNMGEELAFQLQTSEEIQEQSKALREENKRLAREISIWNEKGKEYANRVYQKDCELKQVREKLKQLEQKLVSVVRKHEQDKKTSSSRAKETVNDLRLESEGLRQLVKLKNKELKRVRNLSKIILDHRTDVEQYFIEALEEVKREILETKKNRSLQATTSLSESSSTSGVTDQVSTKTTSQDLALPSISKAQFGAKPTSPERCPISKVRFESIQLANLSSTERQEVLKRLFAKVNALKQPSGTSPLPNFTANT